MSLAECLMPNLPSNFERNLARASTLPAPVYFSPETFEVETATLFASTWQVVGHVHQVASPGDYFTFDLIGEPLLIVRGDDGILRGFYNVCRHRAGNPASGAETANSSAAAITDGPTASTALYSSLPNSKAWKISTLPTSAFPPFASRNGPTSSSSISIPPRARCASASGNCPPKPANSISPA